MCALSTPDKGYDMRACFLGQNICALGYGVATLQTPRLVMDEETGQPLAEPKAIKSISVDNAPMPPSAPQAVPTSARPL